MTAGNLRADVIQLYKNLIYLSREWHKDLRPQIKNAFMKNRDVKDPDEIKKLIAHGEYVCREFTATYHLKKYRTMKKRYYNDKSEDSSIQGLFKDNPRGFHTSRAQHAISEPSASLLDDRLKIMYEGKLVKKIMGLKMVSILTSLCSSGFYGFVLKQKGFCLLVGGTGLILSPFILSPIAIAWLFKRYITRLYYDPVTGIYTAQHFGLFLMKKSCSFKSDDVVPSDVTSVLNVFTVHNQPFFIHDDDLIDSESVELYKKMMGLDSIKTASN